MTHRLVSAAAPALAAFLAVSVATADGGKENGKEAGPAEGEAGVLHADHPLVGTIWSARENRPVEAADLNARLAAADVAILGETHGNVFHHRRQAAMIAAMVDGDDAPSIVFEMIPRNDQDRLDAYMAADNPDPSELGPAVDWEERGWPAWQRYRPIAEVAAANDLPLLAGNVEDSTLEALQSGGIGALDETDRRRLGLDRELPGEAADALDAALFESHCELIPREALPGMRLIQRARDGAMARTIIEAAENGPVALVTGAGHARRDWGVPVQLAARAPGLDVVSVAMIEVAPDEADPPDYLPRPAGAGPVHDYLVFTPRIDRPDPCAGLEEHLERGEGAE